MATIEAEEQTDQRRSGLARLLNWCIVIAVVCVLFHIAITGYFAENHGPQWLWDIYDWKVWPLRPFRQWRLSL